jgi:hypothetical protein|tara:strand:- start:5765 stop:5968 length:204 start_codon:yes stop_codon:yes gene_type:complete
MKKQITLNMTKNALQMTLIAVQQQIQIEQQKSLISDIAETTVKDLQDTVVQLKNKILTFNTKKKDEK